MDANSSLRLVTKVSSFILRYYDYIDWLVSRSRVLHMALGRLKIAKDRLLISRTLKQLLWLAVLFLIVFFFLLYGMGLDNNFLFKGMTTYDYESIKSGDIGYFGLKILYLVGVCFFSGFLVMILTNGVRNNIEKYLAGDVRYRFYNHILIFGYNDIAEGILINLLETLSYSGDIVIIVENKVREVREKIDGKFGKKSSIFVLHGNRVSATDLKSFYPERSHEIFIIGENESNSDYKNLDCYNELRNFEEFSKWGAYIYLFLNEQSSIKLVNNHRFDSSLWGDSEKDNHRLKILNTDERWARRILVDAANEWPQFNLNNRNGKRITLDSDYYVHLIIFGMTSTGEVVAATAAKTCHHPNYVTKGIRTKITIIDNDFSNHRGLLNGRYSDFLKMCHYSIERIQDYSCEILYTHSPEKKLDLLDIEWEFIETTMDDILMQEKLVQYAKSTSSLLSVFICGQDEKQNTNIALGLPNIYYDESIPVWLYTHSESSLKHYIRNSHYDNIITWGMPSSDPTEELWEENAAKYLNVLYHYNLIRGKKAVNILSYDAEPLWEEISIEERAAYTTNMAAVPSIVRSLKNWTVESKDITIDNKEMEIFAQLEHCRWAVCSLLDGNRLLEEDEDIEEKIELIVSSNYRDVLYYLRKQYYNENLYNYDEIKDKIFRIYIEKIQFYVSIYQNNEKYISSEELWLQKKNQIHHKEDDDIDYYL